MIMLTDDELGTLITSRYDSSSLRVSLDEVERRGRQRRRNARIAMGTATAVVALAAAGATVLVLNRHAAQSAAAALDRSCQASYTAEAAATAHASTLPTTLDKPVIEMHRGRAVFRLYAADPSAKRSMLFDCVRAADGSVSGRVTFGTTFGPVLDNDAAYRDYLPDGSGARVGELTPATETDMISLSGNDVRAAGFARSGRYYVIWGPPSAVDDIVVTFVGTGGTRRDAGDPDSLTATYQEPAFAAKCRTMIAENLNTGLAGLSITGPLLSVDHAPAWYAKVYKVGDNIEMCRWSLGPDDLASGINTNGPGIEVTGYLATSGPQRSLASALYSTESDGTNTLMLGVTAPGTQRVQVFLRNGQEIDATVGDGVYLAWLPGNGDFTKLVETTPDTVYTVQDGKVTHAPR